LKAGPFNSTGLTGSPAVGLPVPLGVLQQTLGC
jgi:hypothetical protein